MMKVLRFVRPDTPNRYSCYRVRAVRRGILEIRVFLAESGGVMVGQDGVRVMRTTCQACS